MEPGIKEGSTLLVSRYHYFFKKPKEGDVVVIRLNPTLQGSTFTKEKYMIKRIQKIDGDKIFVVGDNEAESVDGRKFGWISIDCVVGKVIR